MLPAEEHDDHWAHRELDRDVYDEYAVGVALQAEEKHVAMGSLAPAEQYEVGDGHAEEVL